MCIKADIEIIKIIITLLNFYVCTYRFWFIIYGTDGITCL